MYGEMKSNSTGVVRSGSGGGSAVAERPPAFSGGKIKLKKKQKTKQKKKKKMGASIKIKTKGKKKNYFI